MGHDRRNPHLPHIGKDPGIRGGQWCLDGSRIAVTDIVAAQEDGYRPEEIRSLFGASISLAQVHAAPAYYDHPAEIEEEFRLQAECFDQGEAGGPSWPRGRGGASSRARPRRVADGR